MNAQAVAAALRALADAVEAPPDVPVAAHGHVELVDARASGLGVKLFRRLVREGQLAGSRCGRRLMVRRPELDRWLAENAVRPLPRKEAPPVAATLPDDADRALARAIDRGTLRIVKGAK